MASHRIDEHKPAKTGVADALIWLGGGDGPALGEPRERSSDILAGVVVLLNTGLAWLAAAGALAGSPALPIGVAIGIGMVFGLLVGVVSRGLASGARPNARAVAGRAAGALVVGAIAGELASLVLFSGSIQRRIDDQAALAAESVPAVVQASGDLDRARTSRAELDAAVDGARTRRNEALVVARCEYNPSPDCPQTQITGVPGTGPETRTANLMLADAQQELDSALAARAERAVGLDAAVGSAEQALAGARADAVVDPDRGLGSRWVAMNGLTWSSAGALALRLAMTFFFAFLTLLPLILRMWRGETSHDRALAARNQRDVAQLDADTAIAVKQAEVRAETENIWAEQQLASARLAAEAQHEINRDHHRRRVADAVGSLPGSRQVMTDDLYLPIAAEAEAASKARPGLGAELPAGSTAGAKSELEPIVERPARLPLIPALPDIDPVANVRAAARWISPLVPQILARAIDTTKQPLRAARQAFEEVEEITFSFKRVHKVTLHSEEGLGEGRAEESSTVTDASVGDGGPRWVHSSSYRPAASYRPVPAGERSAGTAIGAAPVRDAALHGAADRSDRELSAADGPYPLPGSEGPRELPPADY